MTSLAAQLRTPDITPTFFVARAVLLDRPRTRRTTAGMPLAGCAIFHRGPAP